jgi:hypothetical protein
MLSFAGGGSAAVEVVVAAPSKVCATEASGWMMLPSGIGTGGGGIAAAASLSLSSMWKDTCQSDQDDQI